MVIRPFTLMIDSGAPDEPETRHFGSLQAALQALDELGDEWRPYAWIVEVNDRETMARKPVVHMRDGKLVTPA